MDDGWVDARAKVNVRLKIFPTVPDGYHPIETIFCRISLRDRVRLRRSGGGVRLRVAGEARDLPTGRTNLAVRAAEEFLKAARLAPGVEILLEKAIPQAAGLGGGSSDAAAVLRGLNRLLGEPLSHDRLLELGAGLGADVPFFVLDTPLAFARGRGERLRPLGPLPTAHALVVCPRLRISTGDAYRAWDAWASKRIGSEPPARVRDATWRSWEEVAADAENDFEPIVFERHPELVEIKRHLLESGPYFALLSGSGAAFFAPYPTQAARDAARAAWGDAGAVDLFSVTAPD